MFTEGRDIAAVINYGVRLQEVREEHLRLVTEGKPIPGNFWSNGEAAAVDNMKKHYYTNKARLALMPRDQANAINDAQDFDSRCTKLTEALTLESHKKLVAIPYVGQPEFKDS